MQSAPQPDSRRGPGSPAQPVLRESHGRRPPERGHPVFFWLAGALAGAVAGALLTYVLVMPERSKAERVPAGPTVVAPSSPRSLLEVTSTPPESLVTVDGQLVGITPVENLEVRPGRHHLVVQSTGYEPYVGTLAVESGGRSSLEVLLAQLGGAKRSSARVSGSPSVQITNLNVSITQIQLAAQILVAPAAVVLPEPGAAELARGAAESERRVSTASKSTEAKETRARVQDPEPPRRDCTAERGECESECRDSERDCSMSCTTCYSCVTSMGQERCAQECQSCRSSCERNRRVCEGSCSRAESRCR